MTVSRLRDLAGIGVDAIGDLADRARDPRILRLENLDTDLPPPPGVIEATRHAAGSDAANSYLPFMGSDVLRRAVGEHVGRMAKVSYDWRSVIICAGGLNGILNCLLALLEPGDEVVMPDPIYIGLINRVRLAGGVPVFIPYQIIDGEWRFDRAALKQVVSRRTKMFLMMSPAMPTGAVLNEEDWIAISDACNYADAWLLYDAAMERIRFDRKAILHPASFPGMFARTITVGAVSKEYRMIGWRIGWIVAPPQIVPDISLVTISNVVCPVGIAQEAAAVALVAPPGDLAAANAALERRRDAIMDELVDLPIVKPAGGWSLLMDCRPFGSTGAEFSTRLMHYSQIAATPMTGWGTARSADFIRFVFANEPEARLQGLRARVAEAIPRGRL
ncbi:MAG: pyridoxal phosphate-dependent aminotransferase [Gammaproteobacteria bacterium]